MSAATRQQGIDEDDSEARERIEGCLDADPPQSFFLLAGAGSGKTQSLKEALLHVEQRRGETLRRSGRRCAVITFTNNAADEIDRRLGFNPTFNVRTIHSFAWSLIEPHTEDLRLFLMGRLKTRLAEVREKHQKGRASKAHDDRVREMASISKRLDALPGVNRFLYSPDGDNEELGSMQHAEVVAAAATLLLQKPVLRSILRGRFPFLFIDEAQDTDDGLLQAFIEVQRERPDDFVVGLFGDTMQRIFGAGPEDLDAAVPASWHRPAKKMNHRSSQAVVRLINQIRASGEREGLQQSPAASAVEGCVRLFLSEGEPTDPASTEALVAERMAAVAPGDGWGSADEQQTLFLEHRMAAKRLGFVDAFDALDAEPGGRDAMKGGWHPTVQFLHERLHPLLEAARGSSDSQVMRLLRQSSDLLSPTEPDAPQNIRKRFAAASAALQEASRRLEPSYSPTVGDAVAVVAETGILRIPESLRLRLRLRTPDAESGADADTLFACPLASIGRLALHFSGSSTAETHHGVKGLEFPCVLLVMDDAGSKGFVYKHEALLKDPCHGKHEAVRKLFYVGCSRAKRSLAMLAYVSAAAPVQRAVVEAGWLSDEEIVLLPSGG